jgi:hypothetical protein
MGFFSKVVQGLLDVAVLPVDVVKDVATLGGVTVGESETYTGKRIRQAAQRASEAYDALDDK